MKIGRTTNNPCEVTQIKQNTRAKGINTSSAACNARRRGGIFRGFKIQCEPCYSASPLGEVRYRSLSRVFSLLLLLLCLISIDNTVQAKIVIKGNETLYQIPKTKVAPLIDGQQDNIWKVLDWNMQRIYNVGDPPNAATGADSGMGLTGMSKALWDANNLYILFYSIDDVIVDIPANANWNQDGITLHIDGANDHSTEITLKANQYLFRIPHWLKDKEVGHLSYVFGTVIDTTGIQFKISDVAENQGFHGWMTEVKIPLANLGIDGTNAANKKIGWELQQDESDDAATGRQSMSKWWSNSNNSWANAGIWGTAILDAREVDTVLQILNTSAGITVDGAMDDAYKDANSITTNLFRVGDPPGTDAANTDPMFGGFMTVYPLYDANNLYIFCDVVDGTIVDIPSNPSWNQDAIDIYIDGTNDHSTEMSLKPFQHHLTIPHWLKDKEIGHLGYLCQNNEDTTGIQFKITDHAARGNTGIFTEEGSGWNLEIKIPLANFDMNGSTPGQKFGFELNLANSNDATAGRQGMEKWWNASDLSWANAALWGYAMLGGGQIDVIPGETLTGEYQPDASTVLLLHMNETSGSVVSDASSHGNNARASGTIITAGRFGNARNFSGTNDTMKILSGVIPNSGDFTAEAWAYGRSVSGYREIMAQGSSGNAFFMGHTSDGKMRAGEAWSSTSVDFPFNGWHHFAVVKSNSNTFIYVDGVLKAARGSAIPNPISSVPFILGKQFEPGGEYWYGMIDEVRISNIVRQPFEFNLQLPPVNLIATSSGTNANLSWQNGGGAVPLMKYKIYRGSDSTNVILIDSTTQLLYTNSGLLIGSTYFYRISAVDSTGFEGAKSWAVSVTPNVLVPTIASFTPTSGPIGTTVTITGTNFNTTTANNIVYFGAVKAAVTAASSTSLSVTVPTGATYQPITVTVNGLTACTSARFNITFSSSRIINTTSFSPRIGFTSRSGPDHVDIGDVDSDGKPDLIITNWDSSTVSIFRNIGTIGNVAFAEKVDYTTGSGPDNVSIADIDGDSKLDLVVTNWTSNTVSIFRNHGTNGNVSFSPKVDYATGTGPMSIAIGDIDANGSPDIVVTNWNSNTVSVFRNTGTMGSVSFAPKVDYTTGAGPTDVAVADIDGDGKTDLVVTDGSDNMVSVFRNTGMNGNVSFGARVDYPTGQYSNNVSIVDADGDGKLDFVVTNHNSNSISVFRNMSTMGNISLTAKMDFITGSNPNGIAIGDADGDGKPDLAVTNENSNTVSVFRNIGTIGNVSFGAKIDFSTESGPTDVSIGDVDGDGKPDLVLTEYNNKTVSVLRNTISDSSPPVVTGNFYKIPKTRIAPVIDGKVDPVWNAVACTWQEYFNSAGLPTSWADLSGWSKLLWDDYNIYGLYYVQDNIIDTISTIDWQMDGIEIYIDAGHTHTTSSSLTPPQYQFCLRPGQKIDSVQTSYGHGLKYRWLLDTASINHGGPNGYFVEFSLPLANISIPAAAGTQISLECRQNDNDNDGRGRIHISEWANSTGLDDNWYQTLHWGDAILTDENQPNGQTVDTQYVFLKTTIPPTIDGNLDAVWKQANQLDMCARSIDGALYPIDPQDHFWSFYGLYDDQYIYGFFQVNDNNVIDLGQSTNWQMDGVEFYTDATNSHNTIPLAVPQYMFWLKLPQNIDSVQKAYGHGLQYSWKKFTGNGNDSVFNSSLSGYTVEFKFSLDSLGINKTEGTKFSFELGTDDNDGTGRIHNTMWWNMSGLEDDWQRTLHWGNAKLGKSGVIVVYPPSAPRNLVAQAGNGQVTLKWNKNTESDFLRYRIYRGTSTNPTTKVDSSSNSSLDTTKLLSGLSNGTTYYFRITAVNSAGLESGYSNEVSVIPNVLVPTIASFTPTSGPIGTTVTITGTNFDPTTTNNIIYFGAMKGQVTSATSTLLSVTVPTGAMYQPITVTNVSTGLTAYSSKPFIVTFSGDGAITSSSFAAKLDFTTGSGPNGMKIGDLDGDGKNDLVVVSWNDNLFSILRNTTISSEITNNSFAAKVDFLMGSAVGDGVSCEAWIGDLDGDGKSDLSVTNVRSNLISVFRNISNSGSVTNSSFASKVNFTTGTNPGCVSIGDLDGDGKPDLVAENWTDNTISVLRNTSTKGSISFTPKMDLGTGINPWIVQVSDLDGDSKLDLIVTNSGSNTVSVFRNISTNGNISFATKIDFTTGTVPQGLAIGDLDGDGKSDLVVLNGGDNTFSVFRNTSTSGNISFATKVDFATGNNPYTVAIGDLDGDGKPDLAVANNGSNTVSVYRNMSTNGSILFMPGVDFATGETPDRVVIGDLDGDGKPDLAIANGGSNTVSVLRNTISDSSPPVVSGDFYKIPKTRIVPVIDGKVDPIWNTVDYTWQQHFIYNHPPNWADFSGWTKFLWDEQNIYGLYYVCDNFIDTVSKVDWQMDGVEFFIDANNSHTTSGNLSVPQYLFNMRLAQKVDSVESTNGHGLQYRWLLDTASMNHGGPSGYYVEFKLSLNSLGITAASGTNFSFELHMDDNDGSGRIRKSTWWDASGLDDDWHQTLHWGKAILSDRTVDDTYAYEFLKTPVAPKIDGNLDDLWNNAYQITMNTRSAYGSAYPTDPQDQSWRFYGLYDDHYLYGFYTVYDDVVNSNLIPIDWQMDAVEIYTDPDNSHTVGVSTSVIAPPKHQFCMRLPQDIDSVQTTLDHGLQYMWKSLPHNPNDSIFSSCTGYAVEFRLSLDSLGIGNTAGKKFSFELVTDDNDGSSREHRTNWWSTFDDEWYQTINWGNAKLSSIQINVTPPLNSPPAAPTNLTAIPGDGKILLRWNKNTETDFHRYRIYRGTLPNSTTKVDSSLNSSLDTTKLFIGLSNGITYYFRITAVNSAGVESEYSNEVSVIPSKPAIPIGFSAEAIAESQINLSWSSGGGTILRYRIYRSTDSLNYIKIDSTMETFYSDTTLTQLTSYWYKLTALNSMGDESDFSITVKATTLRPMPYVKSLAVANSPQRGDVKIAFNLRVPVGATANLALSYSIDSGKTFSSSIHVIGGVTNISASTSDTLVWKTDIDLPNFESRAVKFRITPSDQIGVGVPVTTKLFIVDNKAPVFAGLIAALWDTNKVRLRWLPASDLLAPIYYNVYRSISTGAQNFTVPEVVVADTNAVLSNLPALEKEYFVVRASDVAGNKESNAIECSIRIAPPTDFNGDMKINGQDFAIFSWAWRNGNLSVVDVGPATGTPPNFVTQRDWKIDLEDLMIFAQMWDWSLDQPNLSIFKIAQSGEVCSQVETMTTQAHASVAVSLSLPEMSTAQTIEYIVSLNGQKIRIDSIYSLSNCGFTEFKNINAAKGMGFAIVTNLQNSDQGAGAKEYKVSLTTLAKLYKDTIKILINGFDNNAQLKYQRERIIVFNPEQLLPETFALHQNYPNPFNPSTTIEYDLPDPAQVTIKVFNMLGQEIAKFVDGEVSAGYQKIVWNATVTSGVYFYRMEAVSSLNPQKRFVDVKKLLFLK